MRAVSYNDLYISLLFSNWVILLYSIVLISAVQRESAVVSTHLPHDYINLSPLLIYSVHTYRPLQAYSVTEKTAIRIPGVLDIYCSQPGSGNSPVGGWMSYL